MKSRRQVNHGVPPVSHDLCVCGRSDEEFHPCNRYLLSIYCEPDTVLGTGDTAVNNTKYPVVMGFIL